MKKDYISKNPNNISILLIKKCINCGKKYKGTKFQRWCTPCRNYKSSICFTEYE